MPVYEDYFRSSGQGESDFEKSGRIGLCRKSALFSVVQDTVVDNIKLLVFCIGEIAPHDSGVRPVVARRGRCVVCRKIGEDTLAAVPSAINLRLSALHGNGASGVTRQLEVGAKPFIAVAEHQSTVVAILLVGFILPRLVVIYGKLVREAPCPQASVVHPAFHAVSLCAELVHSIPS